MNTKRHSGKGFTLVEIMCAMAILIMTVVASVTGWSYLVRGERMNSVQNELDVQVRTTMERIRQDLRLSSMDHIFVFPQGVSTNTAISFPKARDDDGDGLIELDADGMIIWDITLCYHVWYATPNELRLTTFDPRDNNLNDAQRQSQLESVVVNGNGFSTYNSANASTRALFRNLFVWNIRGRGAMFDAYNPTVELKRNVEFGTCLINPGSHTYKFTVVDKNPLSSGYKVGLDMFVPSPSGIEREGEDQTVSAQSGASPFVEYMGQGAWGGNNQLSFTPGGPGSYFTLSMENDRWEETNFRGIGSLCEDTSVYFDESLWPKDFVLTLPSHTNSWEAQGQTLDTVVRGTSGGGLTGAAVRVVVRGAQLGDTSAIESSGPFHCAWFRASNNGKLKILAAFIAPAADSTTYNPDATNAGEQLTFFYSGGGSAGSTIEINNGDYARAELPAGKSLYVDKSQNYVISFLVDSSPSVADARFWNELNPPNSNGTPVGCYIIPGGCNPTAADTRTPAWSGNTNVIESASLYGLQYVHLVAPPVGYFTSQIVDTGQTTPQYLDINWAAIKPSGTDVKMKVRTGHMPDLSDAPLWTNVSAMGSPGSISPGNKRYIQFQSLLYSGNSGFSVPQVKNVTIRWTGATRLTDVAGTITTGPDYGIMEVTVDNKPLIRGMTVDLTIYKDVAGFGGSGSNRLTSTLTAEVEPRNTGK